MMSVNNDVDTLLRKEIHHLPNYDSGLEPEKLKTRFNLENIIKLSTNENPLGISPKVLDYLNDHVNVLGQYPDPESKVLKQKLAEKLGVKTAQIVIGNGSENILEMLCQTFLNQGDQVITQSPCFGLYEIFPLMMGAKIHKVLNDDSFKVDLDTWLYALKQFTPVKMLLLSNPSNPAGNIFSQTQLLQLIQTLSDDTLLVLDEAYYEYAVANDAYPADSISLLQEHAGCPWIVLRTFSKAYALAGLRVGYGIASDLKIIEALNKVRTPYNINFLAQKAAEAAMDDSDFLQKSVKHVLHEREKLQSSLSRQRVFYVPSDANFLFIKTNKLATEISGELNKNGIIVKPWKERGYENYMRVSIGLEKENKIFEETFYRIINML
nr:histidinol-phosphate transaminase [Acinetobacter sp. Marseille-Q1620]